MARDANIGKRDALVLPGGLLGFYGAVGLILMVLRGTSGPCGDGMRVLYHGACYGLFWPCIVAILVGAVLVGLGVFLYGRDAEGLAGQLHPGTPTHFVLALLVSLVAVPLIGAGIAAVGQGRLGTVFTIHVGDSVVKTTFALELCALVGLLMLVPFLGLLMRDGARRRLVMREAEAMAEQPRYPGEPVDAGLAPPPEEFVDEAAWPDGRGEDEQRAP